MVGPVTLADLIGANKLLWVYFRSCDHERDVTPATVPLLHDTPVRDIGKRIGTLKAASNDLCAAGRVMASGDWTFSRRRRRHPRNSAPRPSARLMPGQRAGRSGSSGL
jgi:hypothetical protein